MKSLTIHFYNSLNDFLAVERRNQDFLYSFKGNPSVKHLVEALRVPHTEVGEIIINGKLMELSCLVQDGDQVNVFPAHPPVSDEDRMSQMVSGIDQPRFLLDNHLGKLAVYLRLLGFDALYRNDYQDDMLVQELKKDVRILLTRDRGLLMRRVIQFGYCIRALDPKQQILEVMRRFNLFDRIAPFQRCLRCNSPLQSVEKESIIHRLEPLTRKYFDEFWFCNHCDQIYWKGSHYQRMVSFLENVKEHR